MSKQITPPAIPFPPMPHTGEMETCTGYCREVAEWRIAEREAAIAAEREACARAVESTGPESFGEGMRWNDPYWSRLVRRIAAAIRARKGASPPGRGDSVSWKRGIWA